MTVDARVGKLIANDVPVLVKKLGVVDAKVEGRIAIQCFVLACGAMAEVRALCWQSALIYPIRLCCATPDGPLSSPVLREVCTNK